MRREGVRLGAVGLSLLLAPAAFAATSPCNQTTEVVSPGTSILSERPARLCGVHLFGTAANSACQVIDSPDGTASHGQAETIAEPTAATSRDGDHAFFGDNGFQTQYGLAVYAVNGRCIVHWGSSP